jgi:hypothetical protein
VRARDGRAVPRACGRHRCAAAPARIKFVLHISPEQLPSAVSLGAGKALACLPGSSCI